MAVAGWWFPPFPPDGMEVHKVDPSGGLPGGFIGGWG